MKKFFRFLVPLLLLAVIVSSIGWYLFVYDRDFTRDFLLSQARYNDLYGNSRLSSWFYQLAYEHSGRDDSVAIELANQYKADGNYTKAEVTLSNAIKNKGELELYIALCRTYVEQDKLLDAVALLDNISNPNMKLALDALRPSTPTSNYEPGYYSEYIDVELSSSSGTLFYTTDGEYPSIRGNIYSEPVELEAGETTIYAISVADNGLVSQPIVMGYTVGGVIEPAVFADDAFEAAVRAALNVSESKILYTNELWNITDFVIPVTAQSIEDLRLLPYLNSLTISGLDLESLSDLSSLNRLTSLDLSGCNFPAEELATVANLPKLNSLTMAGCGLTTVSALEGAKNLTYLDLSSNSLRNLTVLSEMTTLKELHLQHNVVTDLNFLSTLTDLEILNLAHNVVSDLNPLSNCFQLTWLDVSNNALANIYGVDDLALLTHLALDYNSLTDISLAANCKELTYLSAAHNSLTNISALSALMNLDSLNFSYNSVTALPQWDKNCALRTINGSYNAVTSLDSLAGLNQLSYIYMDYNNITSVDALANNYCLVQVNVYGNDIKTVAALTEHDIIVNYDPT